MQPRNLMVLAELQITIDRLSAMVPSPQVLERAFEHVEYVQLWCWLRGNRQATRELHMVGAYLRAVTMNPVRAMELLAKARSTMRDLCGAIVVVE